MLRRKFLFGGMGALASGAGLRALPGASEEAVSKLGLRLFSGADLAFGTTVSVQVAHDNEREAQNAIADALSQARRIDRLMSIYREGSQVHSLNKYGYIDSPDPHLLVVLNESRRLAVLTAGAFDITVQPLWLAAVSALDRTARALVGWRDLHVDRDKVRLARAGMAITLNGIAQGYASDIALQAIRARGINNALVDIGEFAGTGRRPDSTSWRVGIANPRMPERMVRVAELDGRSLATSGDYETAFTADFSQHHIFDPATGKSPTELASVSVAAPSAMLADGLSTALMVLGPARGMALACRIAGVDAFFIEKDGKQSWTHGFPFA